MLLPGLYGQLVVSEVSISEVLKSGGGEFAGVDGQEEEEEPADETKRLVMVLLKSVTEDEGGCVLGMEGDIQIRRIGAGERSF